MKEVTHAGGEVSEKVEMVWGFAVPARSGGRRQWPEALRAMAVERIEAGEGLREIAEEIGARKSLVAHWAKNAKRKDPMPAFFEVAPPSLVKPDRKRSTAVAPEDAAPTLVEVVQRDQRRHLQLTHQPQDRQLLVDVEVVCRLVQQQDPRLLRQRAGQMDALALASRKPLPIR